MTAEERREGEFEEAAKQYLWGDYLSAQTEFEEVEALKALLQKTWQAGRSAGFDEAAAHLEFYGHAAQSIAAVRALKP